MVNEVSSHRSSRNSEKMRPIPPINLPGSDQLKIDLIHQLTGLKRMVPLLAVHHELGKLPQIAQYGAKELIFSRTITVTPTA